MSERARAGRVGIVGCGILGGGVALRLLERGFDVAVFDPRAEALAAAAARGALVCASNRELAAACDRIGIWVQNDAQCERALLADDGVLAGAGAGAVVAIHSTVHPRTVARLGERCAAAGVGMIDAPVAGRGVRSLEDADFWMMVGGDAAVVDRFRDVAATFCSRVLECGALGSAAVLKLAHNVATYIGYVAIVEAQALARAAGVREGALEEVTEASGVLSRAMKLMLEVRDARVAGAPGAQGDELMRTYADILEKDLRVAIEVANEHRVPLPGAAVASQLAEVVYALPRS
ncbi:MAG: NAD(P)-dependent oxidoreductase [Myxococcales bacterium]|nr:NAD(P)-dependent oxidoreductase [Myxococcales bacterium]